MINLFDYRFIDVIPVASALPDRINWKYAGSDPAHNNCVVNS